MKFLHIADLHFGKRLHGFSLIDNGDQPFWAAQFLQLVEDTAPDAVVIAGDVYDSGNPGKEAVALLSDMLTQILEKHIPVLMVAGNHDSGEKLAFLSGILEKDGLYIAGKPEREMKHVTLQDEHGDVTFWLLPFVFPALVADVLEDDSIRDYDTAVRKYIAAQEIDFSRRNVLVAHQNVLANGAEAERGGSETMIGGVGEIDFTAFDGFDYVALGHIHAAQSIGRREVRYAGSPLCYHFSEVKKPKKGPVCVTLDAKGDAAGIELCTLQAKHNMREVRGAFDEILAAETAATARGEYIRAVLTDDVIPVDATAQLKALYDERGSYLMEVVRDVNRAVLSDAQRDVQAAQKQPPEALFSEFYTERTGGDVLDQKQAELVRFTTQQMQLSDTPDRFTDADIEAILKFALEQEGE